MKNKIQNQRKRKHWDMRITGSRSLFFSHSMGSHSDAAIALLPSWKNHICRFPPKYEGEQFQRGACIGHPSRSPWTLKNSFIIASPFPAFAKLPILTA